MPLEHWLNPHYLRDDVYADLREQATAKPGPRYLVLDRFFRDDALQLIDDHHRTLAFSRELDGADRLPYDGEVKFAGPGDVGAGLWFDPAWHAYLRALVGTPATTGTEVKLRRHDPNAHGFWIHSDGGGTGRRRLVAICYLEPAWRVEDGGLLQLWRTIRAAAGTDPAHGAAIVESPGPGIRMDFLSEFDHVRALGVAGGQPDGELVLVDQIVPTRNRLFVCDFTHDPAYHSVTPSNGRERRGWVQWLTA